MSHAASISTGLDFFRTRDKQDLTVGQQPMSKPSPELTTDFPRWYSRENPSGQYSLDAHITERVCQFTQPGDCTTLRLLFAFSGVDECYRDITSIGKPISTSTHRRSAG